jgi:hypothetical protein
MNRILSLTRFLASLILLAALAHGVAEARGTNTTTTQDNSIERGTRQCLREARHDFNRCRMRARGRRGALMRCRREYRQRSSACSG